MAHAIAHLYLAHLGEIRRFLVRRLNCAELASELAQEVFVRYLAVPPGRPIDNPRAFLFRIAGNLATDQFRRAGPAPGQFVDIAECTDLASEAPSPERYAIARQEVARLRRAIEDLPPKCRAVFIRHKFDGVPQATLAGEFGVSLNAIEKHLVRALLHLRSRLQLA